MAMCFSCQTACCGEGTKSEIDDFTLNLIKDAPGAQEYPGLSAVYLYMGEKDYVNEDGTATYEAHIVWKMLDNQAIQQGEINLPFDLNETTLDITMARTIKPDNTVVNVDKENIREVSPYSSFPLYSSLRLKQFSMPSMEIGSIIEYKAVLKVIKPKMPGLFSTYWSFPPGLPVKLSILEVHAPEKLAVDYVSKNLNVNPEIDTKNGESVYKWTAKDIFIGGIFEPMLPPYDMVCPNLIVATVKTWDDFTKWFRGISEPQLEMDKEMKDFVASVVKRKGGDKEKILNELYNFVSQNIRYVAIPLKDSTYQPHKVTEIFTNKYGDCKDKSALLIALCREAGIDAYFALLKTRTAGPIIKKFPVLDFNHCVVAVPKKEGGYTFLDTTLELNRFGYVHTEMRDADILIIKKDSHEFVKVPIDNSGPSGTDVEINMKLADDGSVSVTEKDTYIGDVEISKRLAGKYSTQDATNAFFEQSLKSMYPKARIESVNFTDPSNLTDRFCLELKYEIKDYTRQAGKLVIFDLPNNTTNLTASAEKRIYPLWLSFLLKDTAVINIDIPPGLKLNYLPSDVERDSEFASFSRKASVNKDKITIIYSYTEKVIVIPPDQYEKYKAFMDDIVKISKDSIIFEPR